MNYESIKDTKWPIRSGWGRSNIGKYPKHSVGRGNRYKHSTDNRTGMQRVFVIRQPSLMEVHLDVEHLNNICAPLNSVCCVSESHLPRQCGHRWQNSLKYLRQGWRASMWHLRVGSFGEGSQPWDKNSGRPEW
jgi:hypothetical protein